MVHWYKPPQKTQTFSYNIFLYCHLRICNFNIMPSKMIFWYCIQRLSLLKRYLLLPCISEISKKNMVKKEKCYVSLYSSKQNNIKNPVHYRVSHLSIISFIFISSLQKKRDKPKNCEEIITSCVINSKVYQLRLDTRFVFRYFSHHPFYHAFLSSSLSNFYIRVSFHSIEALIWH